MSWAKYAGYHFATKTGIHAESHTGTHNGAKIDRLTYDHMVATLQVGTMTGTAVDVHVEDSETGTSAWADYTPNVLAGNNNQGVSYAAFPQQTTMGAVKLDVDLGNARRYVRFVGTSTGGAVIYSVTALLGLRQDTVPGSTA